MLGICVIVAVVTSACSSGATTGTTEPPTTTVAPVQSAPAAASISPPGTTPPPSSTISSTSAAPVGPLRVGWIGGSEVVLRDVSLPALANSLSATVDGRPVVFEAYTKSAPSPTDTAAAVDAAIAAGVDALIVTINPQWLYGRVCEDVTPAHARYACLLEVTPVTGGDAIAALGRQIDAIGVPTVLVLMPTSVDALESPILAEPIAVANDRLQELLPRQSNIAILDERLTAGREEFREGVGFYDMVHATPSGAEQLAGVVSGELLRVLQK